MCYKKVQASIAIAWFSYFLSLRQAWEGLYGKDLLKELWNGWIGAMVEYSKRSSSQNCQHGKILMIFLWNIHFSREGGLYNNKLGEIVCPTLVYFNFCFLKSSNLKEFQTRKNYTWSLIPCTFETNADVNSEWESRFQILHCDEDDLVPEEHANQLHKVTIGQLVNIDPAKNLYFVSYETTGTWPKA